MSCIDISNGAARKAARKEYRDSRTMAAYLRKIAIDRYFFQVDHSDIKAMAPEIQKIGGQRQLNYKARQRDAQRLPRGHNQVSIYPVASVGLGQHMDCFFYNISFRSV